MLVGLKSGIMKNFHSMLRCNSRSHSRSFPGIITMSHSRSRNAGMEFPFPFPKIGNGIFLFPFPKIGNEIFHSRSQSLGMGWAIPVPVPKSPKVIPAHPCISAKYRLVLYKCKKTDLSEGKKIRINREMRGLKSRWLLGGASPTMVPPAQSWIRG